MSLTNSRRVNLRHYNVPPKNKLSQLSYLGFALTIIGIVIAFVALALIALGGRNARPNRTKGGGILLIGPIPIIFGSDQQSVKVLVMLAIVLVIVMVALTIIPYLWR
jgi:uncharacterized protein (TIGR00304 family)